MNENFDFIFAGGGLAGLSLAYQMAQSPLRDRSMLIVDRDAKDRDDRTFCFWTDGPTPFDSIVHRSWSQFRVATGDCEQVVPLAGYRYQMIRGLDLYQFIRAELAALPNVAFLQGSVERIEDGAQGARVIVDGQAFRGRWVFDSRFRFPAVPAAGDRYLHLQQRFKGWEIETPEDAFDPQTPIFMDFRTPQEGEMRFFYVLPLSARRALVEYVAPGALDYERALRQYLAGILGIHSFRILRQESGASPITDQPFPRRADASVMNIGVLGGRIKPSTGYAFVRIQDDSRAIVASLLKAGHPFHARTESRYFRFCDAAMLQIMANQGNLLGGILATLFRQNPARRVFRFLDEAATPVENLRLMASLPRGVFVRAGVQVMLRGLRNKLPRWLGTAPWARKPGIVIAKSYREA